MKIIMKYSKATLEAYLLLALPLMLVHHSMLCQGRKNESELIKSICEDFGLKYVLLIPEGESDLDILSLQKELNEVLAFFTSISNFKSLEEKHWRILHERTLVVFYLNEVTADHFASKRRKAKLSHFTWLCLSSSPGVELEYFENVFIPFNCKFFYATYEEESYRLTDIYQMNKKSPKRTNLYGTWNPVEGIVHEGGEIYNSRRNFHQVPLKYALAESSDPFHPCGEELSYDRVVLDCLLFKTWHALAVTLNYSTDYVILPKKPPKNAKELTSPILIAIRKGEVHSAMECFAMTSQRVALNAYMWPIASEGIVMFTKLPEFDIKFSLYLQPFGFSLWIGTLAWLISLTAIMASAKFVIVTILLKKNFRFLRDCGDDSSASFSALCGQSTNIELSDDFLSLRILMIMMYVAPMLLIPSYSGGLISSLANARSKLPFTNVKEFNDNGNYKMISIKFSFAHKFLAKDPLFSEMREKNLVGSEQEMPVDDESAFTEICARKMTYFVDHPVCLKRSPSCRLYAVNAGVGTFFGAMAAPKRFPYKELFDRILQRRQICGIHRKEMEKVVVEFKMDPRMFLWAKWGARTLFHTSQFQYARVFTLEDTLPTFSVFSVGLILTLIVYLLEIFQFRKSLRKKTFQLNIEYC